MMKSQELKIKIKTLTAEARIIRAQELKTLKGARKVEPHMPEIAARLRTQAAGFSVHRRGKVREEARASLLAQAFLNGSRTYAQTEKPRAGNEPNWVQVERIIMRFSGGFYTAGTAEVGRLRKELDAWRQAKVLVTV